MWALLGIRKVAIDTAAYALDRYAGATDPLCRARIFFKIADLHNPVPACSHDRHLAGESPWDATGENSSANRNRDEQKGGDVSYVRLERVRQDALPLGQKRMRRPARPPAPSMSERVALLSLNERIYVPSMKPLTPPVWAISIPSLASP